MDVSIESRWDGFLDELVKSGRYRSADAVVDEALQLVVEREAKLKALREMIAASDAEEGEFSSEEVDTFLDEKLAELIKAGF